MISRRAFLTTTAAAAAASLAPNRLLAEVAKRTPAPPDLSNWSTVRAQFELAPGLAHFASFFLVSHPKPVRDAIAAFRGALDANPLHAVESRMFAPTAANIQYTLREAMAPYLGAKRDEIAITQSTTGGLAMVYAGLPLKSGDEVLTTTHDHYSQHESIRFAVSKAGASMRRIPLYEDAAKVTVDGLTSRLRAGIRPETRVVGLTWVHSCTGVRLPIRSLAQVVAEANRARNTATRIRLVVDGAHGFGAVDETVASMGCDYFCSGTHKWMFAPRGTGIVWASAENWAHLTPTVPSFSSQEAWDAWMKGGKNTQPTTAYDVSPGGFQAYEHQWAMGAAFRFHEAIGRPRVSGRIRELNDQLKRGLASVPNVRVITPTDPSLSAGIVCFEIAGVTPEAAQEKLLAKKVVASASPYLPSYVRLAPSLVNTPEEVDTAVKAVRQLAGA